MGHHAEHIACIIEDACDVARLSIHLFGRAKSHAAFTLQPIKRCFVRDIVAIVLGYGECYLFTGIITPGKGALAVFTSESDVAAHELDAAIAHQRAGKQARFSQYLNAVADRNSTRMNSSHYCAPSITSSACKNN